MPETTPAPDAQPPPLITAFGLSKESGHSHTGVAKALRRHQVASYPTISGVIFYDANEARRVVRDHMRPPFKKSRKS